MRSSAGTKLEARRQVDRAARLRQRGPREPKPERRRDPAPIKTSRRGEPIDQQSPGLETGPNVGTPDGYRQYTARSIGRIRVAESGRTSRWRRGSRLSSQAQTGYRDATRATAARANFGRRNFGASRVSGPRRDGLSDGGPSRQTRRPFGDRLQPHAAKRRAPGSPSTAARARRRRRRRRTAPISCSPASATTTTCAPITLGADGAFAGMKAGAVFVDHTTASAEVARELHAEAAPARPRASSTRRSPAARPAPRTAR